ncbi:MAG: hypothetical protein KatS3mg061_2953 [Dehalococcoidia bacterium]|nr:MAG: hypothetical protein KatS3mg061_2953 [Dehalococcoidia bacterium]
MLNVHGRDLSSVLSADGPRHCGGDDDRRLRPSPALARRFGTPLYLFDEITLRHQLRAFRDAFRAHYPDVLPLYAAKAYLGRALLRLVREEGYGLDVVSGGELAFAPRGGLPRRK